MEINIFNTDKKYNIIYADPPWRYNDTGIRGAPKYDTMDLENICKLPIQDISCSDCLLFIWATYPMIQEALEVINCWGFTYKTIAFQWVKLTKTGKPFFIGTGHYTRANTEACLLGVKGEANKLIQNHSISQLVIAPIQEHSQKPKEVRHKICSLVGEDLPKIELFARDTVKGWDCFGNQTSLYTESRKRLIQI